MKQLLQDLKTGVVSCVDVPSPALRQGHLLIKTSRSLISSGTEKMLVAFGKAGLIGKIFKQTDKIAAVINKIQTDGVVATWHSVSEKLKRPLPLGYCNVGCVVSVGDEEREFAVGDRVVSNGYHAEVVSVPRNLCEKLPDNITDEQASFTVLGAVGLQGVRLAQAEKGECFAVIGLGVIGLLTVQILRSRQCRVFAVDFKEDRLELARRFGAQVFNATRGPMFLASEAMRLSSGVGMDGVIIAAAADNSEPIRQAALMCRRRGRIVLIGAVGMNLRRDDFYEKELSFQVSCSYGPDRYDTGFGKSGCDYAKETWTVRDNFRIVLEMLSRREIIVDSLISHRFSILRAHDAYAVLCDRRNVLGVMLEYSRASGCEAPKKDVLDRKVSATDSASEKQIPRGVKVGVIGAGNYAMSVLLPAMKKYGVTLKTIVSETGLSGTWAARRFGFEKSSTDIKTILEDRSINAVIVATRHDTHADMVCKILEKGKSVFVEKPLAITSGDIDRIESACAIARSAEADNRPILMVGFNRRFSPYAVKLKTLLEGVQSPKNFLYTINAGFVPRNHWIQNTEVGGGRIIGEACHFIDLLRFLAGNPVVELNAVSLAGNACGAAHADNAALFLKFFDGSGGVIHYLSNGHRSYPKERLEVFCGGGILRLDNFCKLKGFGWPGFRLMRTWRQDKGNGACISRFFDAVGGNLPAPVPFREIMEVSRIAIKAASLLKQ